MKRKPISNWWQRLYWLPLLLRLIGNKNETLKPAALQKQVKHQVLRNSSSKESKTQKSSSSAVWKESSGIFWSIFYNARSVTSETGTWIRDKNKRLLVNKLHLRAPSTQQGSQAQSNQSGYDPTTEAANFKEQASRTQQTLQRCLTMVDGDFSAAAGNWKGANGETITVIRRSIYTNRKLQMERRKLFYRGYSYTLDDGKYNAKSVAEKSSKLQQQVRMVNFKRCLDSIIVSRFSRS